MGGKILSVMIYSAESLDLYVKKETHQVRQQIKGMNMEKSNVTSLDIKPDVRMTLLTKCKTTEYKQKDSETSFLNQFDSKQLFQYEEKSNFDNAGKQEHTKRDPDGLIIMDTEYDNDTTNTETGYGASSINRSNSAPNANKQLITCEKCEYGTTRKDRMELHVKRVHDKIKDFVCSECDYSTSDKSDLSKHIRYKHTS